MNEKKYTITGIELINMKYIYFNYANFKIKEFTKYSENFIHFTGYGEYTKDELTKFMESFKYDSAINIKYKNGILNVSEVVLTLDD